MFRFIQLSLFIFAVCCCLFHRCFCMSITVSFLSFLARLLRPRPGLRAVIALQVVIFVYGDSLPGPLDSIRALSAVLLRLAVSRNSQEGQKLEHRRNPREEKDIDLTVHPFFDWRLSNILRYSRVHSHPNLGSWNVGSGGATSVSRPPQDGDISSL